WEDMPSVAEEIKWAQRLLKKIVKASPKSQLSWPLGNHDARFETRLASVASEFKHVKGVHLRDHFPEWNPCWAVQVNGPKGLLIKHRFKGGQNAARNNAMFTGSSCLTGHLHRL